MSEKENLTAVGSTRRQAIEERREAQAHAAGNA